MESRGEGGRELGGIALPCRLCRAPVAAVRGRRCRRRRRGVGRIVVSGRGSGSAGHAQGAVVAAESGLRTLARGELGGEANARAVEPHVTAVTCDHKRLAVPRAAADAVQLAARLHTLVPARARLAAPALEAHALRLRDADAVAVVPDVAACVRE